MKKERNHSLDLIKTFAIIGVLFIHSLAEVYFRIPNYSTESNIILTIDASIFRCAVPFFVMVSGSLLLNEDRKVSTKAFYIKKLLPLCIITLFWFVLYSTFYCLINKQPFFDYFFSFKGTNCPHLWYLILLIGLYLITPILRLFVKRDNKKYILLFIGLSVIFQFLVLFLKNYTKVFDVYFEKMKFGFVTQYVAYYLLGWYLTNFEINKKLKIGLIVLGGVSVVSCAIGAWFNIDLWYGYGNEEGIFTFLYSLGFFLLLYRKENNGKCIVGKFIGSRTFGIYILHMIFVEIFLRFVFPLDTSIINPILYVPILFVFSFSTSLLSAFLLGKIPYVKKLLLM